METFLLLHALYLSGGLAAFLVQNLQYNRTHQKDWDKEIAFRAALISFSSWIFLLIYAVTRLFNAGRKEYIRFGNFA